VVQQVFGSHFHLKLQYEEASKLFLSKLRGIINPERKRKIIGKTFIDVFQAATKRAGKAKFLAQGTLYPDVIESVPIAGNPAAMIKSHHNVGGLPKRMKFALLEPLKCLFKDEVRQLGLELGLPKEIVYRKKKGFANPVGDWLRTSMKPFVHESLLSSDSAAAKFFDQNYIRELLADHEGQQEQRRRHIYLLLSFELWHRQFISA